MDEAISISEAKTHLSRLIARAERGEEIVIRRGKRPVAKIVAIDAPAVSRCSPIGALRGEISIADHFDDVGPEWSSYA